MGMDDWVLGRAFVYSESGDVEYFYKWEDNKIRSICGGLREVSLCRPLDYIRPESIPIHLRPSIPMRKPDHEKLAEEARQWDNGEKTPRGWEKADYALPNYNKLTAIENSIMTRVRENLIKIRNGEDICEIEVKYDHNHYSIKFRNKGL